MKLKNQLERFPEDRILYIGAGVAALVCGNRKQLMERIPDVDAAIMGNYSIRYAKKEAQYQDAVIKYGASSKAAMKAKEKLGRETAPLPLLERKVTAVYERTTEDAANIRLEGKETGNIWSIHETGKPWSVESEEDWSHINVRHNVGSLAAAILKEAVEECKTAFREELDKWIQVCTILAGCAERAEKYEKYFRSSDYKVLSGVDPEYIIRKIRSIVAEEFEKERLKEVEEEHERD